MFHLRCNIPAALKFLDAAILLLALQVLAEFIIKTGRALNSPVVWELTTEGGRLLQHGMLRASLYVWYLQNWPQSDGPVINTVNQLTDERSLISIRCRNVWKANWTD